MAAQNAQFPIHPRLTELVIAIQNEGFIAEEVSPRFKVDTESFKWYSVDPMNTFNIENDQIGNNGDFNEIKFFGAEQASNTVDRGLAIVLPNKKQGTFVPYQTQATSAESLMRKVMLNRERRVASQFTTLANYLVANRVVLSGTDQFNDYVNSNPVLRLRLALDIPIVRPNIVILPRQVSTVLRSHPRVITSVTNDSRQENGVVSLDGLAALLEVDKVIIAGARANIANKGQTASFDRIWGKHIAMVYIDPSIDPQMGGVTFSATAEFESRVARTAELVEKGLRGSTKVMVGESIVEILPSNGEAGYLIHNAIA